VQDYAARKGATVAETEMWLRPNLAYEPADPAAAAAPVSPAAPSAS
jgi:5-methyltetrahydrofolate--homocysteine methyltransferase